MTQCLAREYKPDLQALTWRHGLMHTAGSTRRLLYWQKVTDKPSEKLNSGVPESESR